MSLNTRLRPAAAALLLCLSLEDDPSVMRNSVMRGVSCECPTGGESFLP